MPMFKGTRILVAEDEYFIATELCGELERQGAEVLGPTGRLEEVMLLVDAADRIDAAVLDINLHDVMIYPVADTLRARRIPFVFTTGYDHEALPDRFAAVRRLEKPVEAAAAAEQLRDLIASSSDV